MRNAASGELRLYYSVWSSPGFGNTTWAQQPDDERRNSIWSVRLGPDGSFAGDVRREFLLPDFFINQQDVTRAGFSHPVSDISFPTCANRPIMLVAERGGLRNLGLGADNAFAAPHESRALRYEFDQDGGWRLIGRYDVGFYDRRQEGPPALRANCSGAIVFGYGYNPTTNAIDPGQPDQFVWTSGHALCSPEGPCNLPGTAAPQPGAPPRPAPPPAAAQQVQQGQSPQQAQQAQLFQASTQPPGPGEPQGDESQVHGFQGVPEAAFDEIAPQAAFAAPAAGTEAYPPAALNQAYLIDADVNIEPNGTLNEGELTRNDASRVGDIAVYEICPAAPLGFMPAPVLVAAGHPPPISHAMYASHGRPMSHFRFGSHAPEFSHSRYGSHYRFWSHHRTGSHEQRWSHFRRASHERRLSHTRFASHERARSHYRVGSHNPRLSHLRFQSHNPRLSHQRAGSARIPQRAVIGPAIAHTRAISRGPGHNRAISRAAVHSKAASTPRIVTKKQHVPRAVIKRQVTPRVIMKKQVVPRVQQIQRAPQFRAPPQGGFRRIR